MAGGGRLTTHVLDTMHGKPASGMRFDLLMLHGDHSHRIVSGLTNEDGRAAGPLLDGDQFHLGGYDLEKSAEVRGVFDELVTAGKVRFTGWSTDDPQRAEIFAQSPNCVAIQQGFSLFGGNDATLAVCEKYQLACVLRGPLGMGMLTGKFTSDTKLPEDDIRRGWNFQEGGQADNLKKVEALRDVLTGGGRTFAQGALAWLWARSEAMIPIPGFKTVAQVEENAGAMQFGPLSPEQMNEVDVILGRTTAK